MTRGLVLAAALAAAALAAVTLFFLAAGTRNPSPVPALPKGERLVYFEFGARADTLWVVDAGSLRRQKLFEAPHARDFGVVPSLSPDGRRLAFTALPPAVPAPTPNTPAGLWLAELTPDSTPARLAEGVDLLVRPVWSADGRELIVRRSIAGGYALLSVATAGGETRELLQAPDALFPLAFDSVGGLLYTVLDASGSHLERLSPTGRERLATLSVGLTRDWVLSPEGSRLAYLELSRTQSGIASQAFVLHLVSGERQAVSDGGVDAFGPTWSRDGDLAVGSAGGVTAAVVVGERVLPPPERGFDVPLGFGPGGSLAVRSFEGSSAAHPGRASLTVIDTAGTRRTIATGEVTFVGWID